MLLNNTQTESPFLFQCTEIFTFFACKSSKKILLTRLRILCLYPPFEKRGVLSMHLMIWL